MKSKLLIATEWIWSTRGRDLWLTPNVLTPANAQDKTAPQMSNVEAEGVFKYLEDLKLIYPKQDNNRKTVFCLYELKELEWEEAIADLKKPKWMRSKNVKLAGKSFIWILSLIISGFIGGASRKASDHFYESRQSPDARSSIISKNPAKGSAVNEEQNNTSPPTNGPSNITNK